MATVRRRRLEVEDIGDVTVVNFTDRKLLDEQDIQIIGEQLFSLVDDVGRKKIVLNFSNVDCLSSAAVGKVGTLKSKLNAVGGRLILCNVGPTISEALETDPNKLFMVDPDSDEDDPDANLGGAQSRLRPCKPSGGGSAALRPPPPEGEA
jgi:anti-sigma B factor antagonist